MISMTFDDYTELDDKIASLPKRNENYGLEEKDLKRIEADPDRYYRYSIGIPKTVFHANSKKIHIRNKDYWVTKQKCIVTSRVRFDRIHIVFLNSGL